MIKKQYRISTWRFDVPKSTYSTPTFEGETLEECDEKAKAHFDELSAKKALAWEGMDIFRIDAPAIAEQKTFLKDNGRQKCDD